MSWYGRGRSRSGTITLSAEMRPHGEKITPASMYAMRHKGEFGYTKAIGVRCQGTIHKITLRQRGPITLENHRDLKAEATMMKLGGDKPRCLRVYEEYVHKELRCLRHKISAINSKEANGIVFLQRTWREKRDAHRAYYIDILTIDKLTRYLKRVAIWKEGMSARLHKEFHAEDKDNYYAYSDSRLGASLMPTKMHAKITSEFKPQEEESE